MLLTQKLIIFLIRRRLGLKKYERFRFINQKSKDNFYFFNSTNLIKYSAVDNAAIESHVSLNWLLSDKCEIMIMPYANY